MNSSGDPVRGRLRLIEDGAHSGVFNMSADELLFQRQIDCRSADALIRFYRFSEPTTTVGYGAWRLARRLCGGLARNQVSSDVPVIRRATGGGIVRHETDFIYSLVVPIAARPALASVQESYFLIHRAFQQALKSLGLESELYDEPHTSQLSPNFNGQSSKRSEEGSPNFNGQSSKRSEEGSPNFNGQSSKRSEEGSPYCFDTPVRYDVMLCGEKIAGAGQRRSRGYLLQQGSIAWRSLTERVPMLSESAFTMRFALSLADALGFEITMGTYCTEV
ncbi:MAG: hypothetical protein A3A73_04525 [Omnitrophica bacterium RIFCSPLOWO2_01_FULL_50_24]|nr:MAG: hypothetical protein A3A73_04525 [Omnitrophica bacterium RIFCSPLOWO2_01_FULL_50_24]